MENNSTKLGKGLAEMLGVKTLTDAVQKLQVDQQFNRYTISLSNIYPNPFQPRIHFDEQKLQELSSSILEFGVLTPVLLRKKNDEYYEIVAGERRVRASILAGKSDIAAVLADFSDEQMMEVALIENIQREALTLLEEAHGYQNILNNLQLTQSQLSKRVGKSRSYIANILRLLSLPENIQELLNDNSLTMGHLKPLVGLSKEAVAEIAFLAIEQKLNVREVEKLAKDKKNKQKLTKKYKIAASPTKTKISYHINEQEKKVLIDYENEKDLKEILSRLQ